MLFYILSGSLQVYLNGIGRDVQMTGDLIAAKTFLPAQPVYFFLHQR